MPPTIEQELALAKAEGEDARAPTKAWVLDLITRALSDRPSKTTIGLNPSQAQASAIEKLMEKKPNKFMSREWLVALAVIAAGGLLIYKGEMDRGVELVKWTMVAFIGSRTAVKGLEVFKKNSA